MVCHFIITRTYVIFLSEEELLEKAKYLAVLWVATDKEFKESSLSLMVLDWKKVIGF